MGVFSAEVVALALASLHQRRDGIFSQEPLPVYEELVKGKRVRRRTNVRVDGPPYLYAFHYTEVG